MYSTLALGEIVKEETALRKENEAVCCYLHVYVCTYMYVHVHEVYSILAKLVVKEEKKENPDPIHHTRMVQTRKHK